MTKRILASLFVLTFAHLILNPQPSQAAIYSGDITEVKTDQVIEDDVFITGKTVNISGHIKGDVYIAADTISVSGVIDGDILAGGGIITLDKATIGQDVRLIAGQISISNSEIGDNISALGGSVLIKSSKINGTLFAGCGMLQVDGEIGRNLYGGAGSVSLAGQINKEVRLVTENLSIASNTVVKGPLTYYSEIDAIVSSEAKIEGGIQKEALPQFQQERANFRASSTGLRVFFFLSMLLVGILIVQFLPRPLNLIQDQVNNHVWASTAWGLIIFILTLPVLVLLSLTGIGIPLALILGLLFIIEIMIAPIIVGVALGRFVLSNLNLANQSLMMQLLVGLSIYYLIAAIPLLSGMVWLISRLIALGAIFLYKRQVLGTRAGS